jgi:16S rRNA (adenine1518-N6/adenine1519-N6)-dimethyltransferase
MSRKSPIEGSQPRYFAKRSLGQNFLTDPNTASKIVKSLEPKPGERVLEIGPGRGALTCHLIKFGMEPLLLELDRELAFELKSRWPQLDVVLGDAKQFPFNRLGRGGIEKVIGNLPYNVGSVILWEFACKVRRFNRAVFMLQREVARRIVSGPGSREYGILSVWVQSFTRPKILFDVGPAVFKPKPRVHSSVLLLQPNPDGLLPGLPPEALSRTIKFCFQSRRKQLGTILKGRLSPAVERLMTERAIDPSARPESLSPLFFQELALILASGPSST